MNEKMQELSEVKYVPQVMETDRLSQLVQDVHEGHESGLKALGTLKEQMAFIKDCIEEIESLAMEEAQKYNESQFQAFGYKITVRKGGRVWNFKKCPQWALKKAELVEIETGLKGIYEAHKIGTTPVDDQGEIMTLPAVTEREDSISFVRI